MEMSSTPVSEIQIITKNNAISIDEYKSMVKFLSTELGVKVKAFETLRSAHPWLSINHFVDLFLVWGVPVLEFLVVVGLGFG
jgi:hypothetical protein